MSERPTLTVAIPCYNAAAFVAGALRSVGRQTTPPDQVLVVDDGSVDASAGIVDGFSGVERISHRRNRGIAAARNTAWRHARGDVVVYIDADTRAHPRLLESLTHGYTDAAVAGVGGRGREVVARSLADRWRREVLFQGWGASPRPDVPFLFGLCASFRVRVLERLGGFDPTFRVSGEDMDLSFRARRAGFRLVYRPEAVVDHLRADDGRSIGRMTYRHCYGGFRAMRVNRCYRNKLPTAAYGRIFLRHLLDARRPQGRRYAALSIRLHAVVLRAWFDARRAAARSGSARGTPARPLRWEGHAAPAVPGGRVLPAGGG